MGVAGELRVSQGCPANRHRLLPHGHDDSLRVSYASKEKANKLKVELLRKACASDGARLLGADPPHEEDGMSEEKEPAEEEEETKDVK